MAEVKEELKPFYNSNSEAEQLIRLGQLSPHLAELGKTLIGRVNRRRGEKCEPNKLNDLTTNERTALFTALYPGIAEEVECAYLYFDQLTKLAFERESGLSGSENKITHIAQNTAWLIGFVVSIQGFEDQTISWLIEHESHFYYLGHLLAAVITKQDYQGLEILDKVLSIPQPSRNVLITFLCTPLYLGKPHLEKTLDSLPEKGFAYYTHELPVHPMSISYAYEYVLGKKNIELSQGLARSIHRNRNIFNFWNPEHINRETQKIIEYIHNPEKIISTIQTGTPAEIYLALVATALQDQKLAVQYITEILKSGKQENVDRAGEILISLNIKEVIPLVLDCVKEANPIIIPKLFSHRFHNGNIKCNYFERYLNCYQDHLASSGLFEWMERIHKNSPDVIKNPEEQFINYLGDRSLKRLDFLGELDNQTRYRLVCQGASRVKKDQETINFLVNAAQRKFKVTKEKWVWIDQYNTGLAVYHIQKKALEALLDVNLTIEQLTRIMSIDAWDDEDLRSDIFRFFSNQSDETLQTLLLKCCSSAKKQIRLGTMRVMVGFKKENRLITFIQERINAFRTSKIITEDEIFFLNTFLCNKTDAITYEDLLKIQEVKGANNLFILMSGLRGGVFIRNRYHSNMSHRLSTKILRCSPIPEDTYDLFVNLVNQYNIPNKRLIELAFFAPQWRDFVGFALGNIAFVDSVDWFLSQTEKNHYVDLSKNTSLVWDDLHIGAVDVNWFNRVNSILNEHLLYALLDAARFASTPREYARIRLNTDVLFGKYTVGEIIDMFRERELKNHVEARDYIRALGLVPLIQGPDRMKEIIYRYQIIKDYIHQSKQYGINRRLGNTDAGLAGLKNLANNSGFTDLRKFELAMDTESVNDLSTGPVILEVEDYRFILSINHRGEPSLEIRKGEIPIRSIPNKMSENESVRVLKERVKQLRRQVRRLRIFLEESMCNSDEYSWIEFRELLKHPILRPMMEQLVFVSSIGMGYPIQDGKALYSYDGKEITLGDPDTLRIAHSYDLMMTGSWDLWQHECFASERLQPFKQVFREVYVVTEAEKNEDHESRRYFGQNVRTDQAARLLLTRNWRLEYEPWSCEGKSPSKYFYKLKVRAINLIAFLERLGDWAEMVDSIYFRNKYGDTIPLEDIPPIIFSETMRDWDLVVSVAYAGQEILEASTSTLESRIALVRETCSLLNLKNVQVDDHFAMIAGTLGNYKVHLGSGSIHLVPGNYVCVIPDEKKFVGKLFLPFIEKDQMTSIILSKIILLARDERIKDPVILRQISRPQQ